MVFYLRSLFSCWGVSWQYVTEIKHCVSCRDAFFSTGPLYDVYYLSVRDGYGYLCLADVRRWKCFLCCFQSCNIIVLMLISDLFAQNNTTPLHLAAVRGHHEICQYLIEHGASVNVQDKVRDGP